MAGILTFAEQRDGKLRRASLEAVSEARRLAGALGGPVTAVLVGSGVEGLAAELGAYGADTVHVFDQGELALYATEPYARAVAQAVKDAQPAAVLVPFTAMGKDLAPRVAAELGAPRVSDCVALTQTEGRLEARRPMYAGKAFATVRWRDGLQMASLRPNVFALGARDDARKPEVKKGTVDAAARARVTKVEASAGGKVELTEAQTIVSG